MPSSTSLSENSLIGETTAPHWPYLRRVMGEVLRDDAQMPQTILGEHVAILDAMIAGDGARAEMLSRDHISRAAKIFVQRLQAQQAASEEEMRQRRYSPHQVTNRVDCVYRKTQTRTGAKFLNPLRFRARSIIAKLGVDSCASAVSRDEAQFAWSGRGPPPSCG